MMRALLSVLVPLVLISCQDGRGKEDSNPQWDGVSVRMKDAVVVASVHMESMRYSRWWYEQDALSDSTIPRH